MYQIFVAYNQPQDPDAFLAHYSSVHTGLARAMPGLSSFDWVVCETLDGSPSPFFVMARLTWPTKDDALKAMGSPEGQAAVGDLADFATAGAAITAGEIRS